MAKCKFSVMFKFAVIISKIYWQSQGHENGIIHAHKHEDLSGIGHKK
jgi:hypothetical protein